MMDVLKPSVQFMHDLLDFKARNHHVERNNLIHDRFRAYCQGFDSVEKEIKDVAEFLVRTKRRGCKTVVVDSNHHDFLTRWLRNGSFKNDPVNALFYLEAQRAYYRSIQAAPDRYFNIMRWSMESALKGRPRALNDIKFLDQDESYVVCHDNGGGIECGMHGHEGPNGSQGSARTLARMGRRANIGHSHSAGIFDGVYQAGLSGVLDQGYNTGPGSWSHSHIVTYANGKRAIITMFNGKWRA